MRKDVKREVRIAEFKAHLSAYVRAVRGGREIVIKDRDTPVARLVPHDGGRRRAPAVEPAVTMQQVQRRLDRRKSVPLIDSRVFDQVCRETKMDVCDKWLAGKLS